VQLDAFSPTLREAVVETLGSIAAQCDGVRCDMAMLTMNDTFERTWGDRAGPRPDADCWPTVIPAVKDAHPGFVFIAEAYWDLEWALQQQGFDYCYDKRCYDRGLVEELPRRQPQALGLDDRDEQHLQVAERAHAADRWLARPVHPRAETGEALAQRLGRCAISMGRPTTGRSRSRPEIVCTFAEMRSPDGSASRS
jgi:hypothetical protein